MNTSILLAASAMAGTALVATPAWSAAEPGAPSCKTVASSERSYQVMLGKSRLIPLEAPVIRILSGPQPARAPAQQAGAQPGAQAGAQAAAMPLTPPPGIAADQISIADLDVLLLSPTDLFLRGKKAGATNVIVQDATGVCYLLDVVVAIDPATLQAKLADLLPLETKIVVKSAENSIVLTGEVRDAAMLDEAMRVASAYGDGKRVVNLLRVSSPQQVMLEVKIAEVSKTLLDKFGIDFARMFTSADGLTSKVISGVFGGVAGAFGKFSPGSGGSSTVIGVNAQKKDGLVRVLAEPNIMALSGQSASFNSGGKIFIPVAHTRDIGGSTITLEEKPFGVSLKFSPTVLDGDRVNLKLVSEVSELAQTGSPFTTTGGVTAILPSLTSRNIDTTVQLRDGQSFAVAGLIRNNITETLSRFPILGELPILGALFRSTEFQKDQTELIFIVTPRLVKPAALLPAPTDYHGEPSRAGIMLLGRAEGKPAPAAAPATEPGERHE
jgi:pilus assembly protein CpaC